MSNLNSSSQAAPKSPKFSQSDPSSDNFRLLVDSIPDYAIFMIDNSGIIQTWNNGAKRLEGFEHDEIIGQHFSVFFTPEDLQKGIPEKELQEAKALGRYETEGWRIRKDGSKFWAGVSVTPIIDEAGVQRGYGKVTRDLSERRRFEQRHRLMVESVKDYGIFMLDPDGIVKSWNLGAELIKGYKADEIIGKHFSTFYTEPDILSEHPQDELKRAVASGRFEEEGWRVRKDGSQFWANVVITPLYDDNKTLIGFSKVTRDLTSRKKAENELRESEEKFRLMVSSVRDYAIIMLDPNGIVSSWNNGAERIKGWKQDEIVGKSFETFYPPEDVEAGKTKMELEIATRDGRFEDFGWRVRKDGTRFWANVVITALRDDNGQLRGFSKVTRDITDRKNAEEQIAKAYEELESFSYSVSHDLRAPLRSMDGFSDILLATVGDKLDAKSKNYLIRIRESSQRMARLIDDLLNLSRLSREPLNLRKVDVSGMAQKVAGELRKAQPGGKFEVTVQPHMTAIADPGLLQVVIENLIGNAVKYSSKAENPKVEVGCRKTGGDEMEFFVKDNGAGFDMSYQDKLFGAFQRLHGVNEFPGTGIGLATVKRIIHRHGGNVRALGKPNEGATFYFTLKV